MNHLHRPSKQAARRKRRLLNLKCIAAGQLLGQSRKEAHDLSRDGVEANGEDTQTRENRQRIAPTSWRQNLAVRPLEKWPAIDGLYAWIISLDPVHLSTTNYHNNRRELMPSDEILIDTEQRMEKAIEVLKKNLGGIRTGRANPGLVDSVRVDVYGSPTPLKQIASVGAPEPTQIVIRPYDTTVIKEIEKAIVSADLGFNPQSDGRVVRINIPALSTDVRKKMVGRIKELTEEAKISIRNVRRDGNKAADGEAKDKVISEDQRDDIKSSVQDLTKKFEEQAEGIADGRKKEVMDDA